MDLNSQNHRKIADKLRDLETVLNQHLGDYQKLVERLNALEKRVSAGSA